MRTICDACESAPAVLFCAADEAALCTSCDHKVHMCNKLANRHVRVGLADPSEVPCCDICENAPGHVENRKDQNHELIMKERMQNHIVSAAPPLDANGDGHGKMGTKMIDLNTRPYRTLGQASSSRGKGVDHLSESNNNGP